MLKLYFLYLPASHGPEQELLLTAPTTVVVRPALHAVQEEEPLAAWYWPIAQLSQAVALSTLLYLPVGHE